MKIKVGDVIVIPQKTEKINHKEAHYTLKNWSNK